MGAGGQGPTPAVNQQQQPAATTGTLGGQPFGGTGPFGGGGGPTLNQPINASNTGINPTTGVATPLNLNPPGVGLSPYPNQQIAPLSNQQLAGMNLTSQISPGTQNYLGNMMNASNFVGQGGLMNPATNPFLNMTYAAAALPQIQNFQQATMPNIMQNMASTGTLGSSGYNQAIQNAQSALAQGLGTTAAGIFEPAYQQGLNAMMGAQGMAPQMAQGQYIPSQALTGAGGLGQQQAQNILNAAYQNQYQQANWPFQALGQFGQLANQFGGGGTQGTAVGTSPNTQAGK